MTLFDGNGDPVVYEPEVSDRCTSCGSDDIEKSTGFGGYWKDICRKCGTQLAGGKVDAQSQSS